MRLKDKTALITGAGSGMGRSAALLFAREGALVLACDVKQKAVDETVAMVSSQGGNARAVVADVSNSADVESAVICAEKLDILYNSAGIWLNQDGPAPELSEETWDRVINVNLKGTFLCCKYAIPAMVNTGGGSIINVSSISALRAGKDNYDAYAASKGGIISFTLSVASTWGVKNIRANVICPGSIDTPMTSGSYEEGAIREFWRTRTALGRVGEPLEVAQTALWLASDDSSYVTGSVILVDGGYMTK